MYMYSDGPGLWTWSTEGVHGPGSMFCTFPCLFLEGKMVVLIPHLVDKYRLGEPTAQTNQQLHVPIHFVPRHVLPL